MKSGILLATRWAVLPLLLFSPGQLDFRPQGSPRDSAPGAIIAILNEQQAAWNRGDVVGFMNGYWKSPQLTFAGSGGITRGWQNVQERYRKNYPDARAMGHLDFSALEVHPLGRDAALVLGRWHLERTSGELGGVFTLVFQRVPEGWRIVHDHTSADQKKP
jgi:ketosteroid isomerase-like protein